MRVRRLGRLLAIGLGAALGAGCGSSHGSDDHSQSTGGTSAAGAVNGGSSGTASGAGGSTTGGVAGSASGAGGSKAGGGGTSGSASGAAGSGAVAGAALDRETAEYRACAAYLTARCERLEECGSYRGPSCLVYDLPLCPDLVFGPGSNNTPELILGCADAWKDAPCSVLQTYTPVCIYAPGDFENGAACTSSSQCQSGACSGSSTYCGTCEPVLEPGADCSQDQGACPYGTDCRGTTCEPRPPALIVAGEACELNVGNCEAGTVCRADDDGNPKCQPPLDEGSPCAYTVASECRPSTYCESTTHVCTAGPPAGMPCGGSNTCDADSLCDTRATPQMCVPRVALGEPCFDLPNVTDPHGNCSGELFCVCDAGEDCNDGVCVERAFEGEACDETKACIAGTTCRAGKCEVSGLQNSYADVCVK